MKPRSKSVPTKREIFTALGEIKMVEGKKRFVPKSPDYMNDNIRRLAVGTKIKATFHEERTLRSINQLRYHFVLCGYIADYTGHSKEEIHDAIMRVVFGTKEIRLGDQVVEGRRSLADGGDVAKWEAVQLVDYDLALCARLDIHVPSAEELGYLPS